MTGTATKPTAHIRILCVEFPFFNDGWSRLGGYGNVEFWKAGGNGGSVILRVLGERANQIKEVFVPPNSLVIVELIPYGVDGVPTACRVSLPVEEKTS